MVIHFCSTFGSFIADSTVASFSPYGLVASLVEADGVMSLGSIWIIHQIRVQRIGKWLCNAVSSSRCLRAKNTEVDRLRDRMRALQQEVLALQECLDQRANNKTNLIFQNWPIDMASFFMA